MDETPGEIIPGLISNDGDQLFGVNAGTTVAAELITWQGALATL